MLNWKTENDSCHHLHNFHHYYYHFPNYSNKGSIPLIFLVAVVIGIVICYLVYSNIYKPNSSSEELKTEKTSRAMFGTEQDFLSEVNSMIKRGNDIEAGQNQYGQTLLHIAAKLGYFKGVKLLLGNGANVNARDSLNGTPLHRATQNGHIDVVKILLEHGADIEARYKTGQTPIYFAIDANSNQKEMVKLLLDSKASTNIVDNMGIPPLCYAIHNCNSDVAKLLIEYGADVNFRNEVGTTLLHKTAYQGCPKIAELLIRHGANVSAVDKSGKTPLVIARQKPLPGVSQADKDQVAQVLQAYGGK
jgi:ankyrin repeat protein